MTDKEYKKLRGRMGINRRVTLRNSRRWAAVNRIISRSLFRFIKKKGMSIEVFYYKMRRAHTPYSSRWLTCNDIESTASMNGYEISDGVITPTAMSRKFKKLHDKPRWWW